MNSQNQVVGVISQSDLLKAVIEGVMENKEVKNPSRSELITDFVKTNPNYYIDQFQK